MRVLVKCSCCILLNEHQHPYMKFTILYSEYQMKRWNVKHLWIAEKIEKRIERKIRKMKSRRREEQKNWDTWQRNFILLFLFFQEYFSTGNVYICCGNMFWIFHRIYAVCSASIYYHINENNVWLVKPWTRIHIILHRYSIASLKLLPGSLYGDGKHQAVALSDF